MNEDFSRETILARVPMDDLPLKLPKHCLNTVWGCPGLTIGERLVFFHDWDLDVDAVKRCYASNEFIADSRLKGYMSASTVGQNRTRLKDLGLHLPVRIRGLRNFSWVCTLPPQLVGRDARHSMALADRLVGYIQERDRWLTGVPSPGQVHNTSPPKSRTPDKPGTQPQINRVGGESREGVRGSTPTSALTTESQLLAVVKDPEEQGVVAHATPKQGVAPSRIIGDRAKEADAFTESLRARFGKTFEPREPDDSESARA